MLVTKISILPPHKTTSREINISEEQLAELELPLLQRRKIQEIVPHLSADDREFLISGITPEEWNETFKDE